jgi:hypothetical protein
MATGVYCEFCQPDCHRPGKCRALPQVGSVERKYRELVENAHEVSLDSCARPHQICQSPDAEITGHDRLENIKIYDLLDQDNQKLLQGVMNQNRMNHVASRSSISPARTGNWPRSS